MGGKTSLNKGKRGEREIVKLLQPIVDEEYRLAGVEVPKIKRNTLQSDSGGFDLVGLDSFAIEVKFQETFNLKAWWGQTLAQANDQQLPVLFYRKSRVAWRVRTWGTLIWQNKYQPHVLVDISLEDFLTYFRMIIKQEINYD